MSKKKEKKPFDPEHMTPEEQLKFEIAEELAFTFLIRKRTIASTFFHPLISAIIVSHYTQSKKFSTELF